MDWAKLLLACVRLMTLLFTYAREKQLLDAGSQQALASLLKAQADDLEKDNAVRKQIRERNAAVPSTSSLPNDGFRRD